MAEINLAAIMDAIADIVTLNITTRAYAWPAQNVNVPCVVVGYPEEIEFDVTMNRGSDTCTFPLYYMAGSVNDRTTRDELSRIIAGANSFKEALDGDLDGAVASAEVTNCTIQTVTVGAIDYLSARFDLEVYT